MVRRTELWASDPAENALLDPACLHLADPVGHVYIGQARLLFIPFPILRLP